MRHQAIKPFSVAILLLRIFQIIMTTEISSLPLKSPIIILNIIQNLDFKKTSEFIHNFT